MAPDDRLRPIRPNPEHGHRHAGLVGEHNAEVLTELGYEAASIEELRAAGVIGDKYE